MLNLGKVQPGSTIYIPFETFASSTGAPITLTGLATSDILVYKDGGTTQRASASGFTLLDTDGIDFDGITGIHGFSIDLSDNTTADFWASGSRYFVVVSTVTVDSQTMSFIAATFSIGEVGSILDTTIATLSSQTSFTLTTGPADNSALVGCVAVIHDAASAVQQAIGVVSAYTGSTKTVTLLNDPAIFTMAAKDNISFMPSRSLKPTVDNRTLDVSAGGEAGLDWANVGTPGSTVGLSATTVATVTTTTTATNVTTVNGLAANVITATSIAADAITDAKVASDVTIASVTGAVGSVTGNVGGNVTGSVGSIATGGIAAASFAAGAIDAAAMNVTGSEFTAIPWNAAWDAEVQSEVDDALVAQRLDELLNADSDIDGAAPPTVGSVFHELMTKTAGSFTYDQTTDSLEAVRDRGDAAWITATGFSTLTQADVRTAVGLASANLDTQLSTIDDFLDTEVAAIKAKTDNLPSAPAATGDAMTLTSAYDFAKGSVAMTEGYAADGATATPVQMFYMLWAAVNEFAISGTTITAKKLDGSTSAMTWTLNDATSPTSRTRAT